MELQAHELRIGNLFQEQNSKEIIMVTELSQFKIGFSGSFKGNWQAEPIPLTEEWLLKFGFLDTTGVDYIYHVDLDFKLIIIPASDFYPQIDKADDSGWKSVSLNKIKYVHQLQNLYFALTGEELKLNDPLQ